MEVGARLSLIGLTLINGYATDYGGTVTVRRDAYLYLERSQILFSYAKSYGGAVYSNYATVVANATRFENCSAATDSGRGGALAVLYGNLTLESTRWSGVAPHQLATLPLATLPLCHPAMPESPRHFHPHLTAAATLRPTTLRPTTPRPLSTPSAWSETRRGVVGLCSSTAATAATKRRSTELERT